MNTADTWQPAATAPRDGKLFLADTGYPWPVLCAWSAMSEKWATTSFCASGSWGGADMDCWFETEFESPAALKRWRHLPELPKD